MRGEYLHVDAGRVMRRAEALADALAGLRVADPGEEGSGRVEAMLDGARERVADLVGWLDQLVQATKP